MRKLFTLWLFLLAVVWQASAATVYFDNSTANWSTVKIYYWEGQVSNTWSGDAMTSIGNDIYKFDFNDGTPGKVIFNNGSNAQTANLIFADGHIYNKDSAENSTGTAYTPPVAEDPIEESTNHITVYFENTGNWSQPYVHYWTPKDSSEGNWFTTTWPGKKMTPIEGTNIWKCDAVPDNAAYIIFNNNEGMETGHLVPVADHKYTTAGDQGVYTPGEDPVPPTPSEPIIVYVKHLSDGMTLWAWGDDGAKIEGFSNWGSRPAFSDRKVRIGGDEYYYYTFPANVNKIAGFKVIDASNNESNEYTSGITSTVCFNCEANEDGKPVITKMSSVPEDWDYSVYIVGYKGWETTEDTRMTKAASGNDYTYEFATPLTETAWKVLDRSKGYNRFYFLNQLAVTVNDGVDNVDDSENVNGYIVTTGGNGDYKLNFNRIDKDHSAILTFNNVSATPTLHLQATLLPEPTPSSYKDVYFMGLADVGPWEENDTNRFYNVGDGTFTKTLNEIKGKEFKIKDTNITNGSQWLGFKNITFKVNGQLNTDIVLDSDEENDNSNYHFDASRFASGHPVELKYFTAADGTHVLEITATLQKPNPYKDYRVCLVGNYNNWTESSSEALTPDATGLVKFSDVSLAKDAQRFRMHIRVEGQNSNMGEKKPYIQSLANKRMTLGQWASFKRTSNYDAYTELAGDDVEKDAKYDVYYDVSTLKCCVVKAGEERPSRNTITDPVQNVAVQGYGSDWGDDVAVLVKGEPGLFNYRFKDLRLNRPFLLYDYNTTESEDGETVTEQGYIGYEAIEAAIAAGLFVNADDSGKALVAPGANVTIDGQQYRTIMFVKTDADFVNITYNRLDPTTPKMSVKYFEASRDRDYEFGKRIWAHWRNAGDRNIAANWKHVELLLDEPDEADNPTGINCPVCVIYPSDEEIYLYLTTTADGSGPRYGNNVIDFPANTMRDGFASDYIFHNHTDDLYKLYCDCTSGEHSNNDYDTSATKAYKITGIVPGDRYRVIISPKTNKQDEKAVPKFSSFGVFSFPDESRPWGELTLRLHSNLIGEWRGTTDANVSESPADLSYNPASNAYYYDFKAGEKNAFSDNLVAAGVIGSGHEFVLTDSEGVLWFKSPVNFPLGVWVPNALQIHTSNDDLNFYTSDLVDGEQYRFQLRYNNERSDWEARFVKLEPAPTELYIQGGNLDGIKKMRETGNAGQFVRTFIVDANGFKVSTHNGEEFEANLLSYIGERLETENGVDNQYSMRIYNEDASNSWYVADIEKAPYNGRKLITVTVDTENNLLTVSSPTVEMSMPETPKAIRASELDPEAYLLTSEGNFNFATTEGDPVVNTPQKIRHFNKIQSQLKLNLEADNDIKFVFVSLKIEGKDVVTGLNDQQQPQLLTLTDDDFVNGDNRKPVTLNLDYMPYVRTGGNYTIALSYRFSYQDGGETKQTPIRTARIQKAAKFDNIFVAPMSFSNMGEREDDPEGKMRILYGQLSDTEPTAMVSIKGIKFGMSGTKQIYRPTFDYQETGTPDTDKEEDWNNSKYDKYLATYLAYDFKIGSTSLPSLEMYSNVYKYLFNKIRHDHPDISEGEIKAMEEDFLMDVEDKHCWSQCAVNTGKLAVLLNLKDIYGSVAAMKEELKDKLEATIWAVYPIVNLYGGKVSVNAGTLAPMRRAHMSAVEIDNDLRNELEQSGKTAVLLDRDGDSPTAVVVKDIVTGIEEVSVDYSAEDVEYYNLQGLRIAEPQKGQIVIRRQGNQATKIRF